MIQIMFTMCVKQIFLLLFSKCLLCVGHLGLGRLIMIYDSNHITIDGSTELSFTENVAMRFTAYKWHVQVLPKSMDNDFISLIEAIEKAKAELTKPSLIIATTTIAYGSLSQGHHKSQWKQLETIRTTRKDEHKHKVTIDSLTDCNLRAGS